MLSLNVVIGDRDVGYSEKLSTYLKTTPNYYLKVFSFFDETLLSQFLENNPVDVLLITENFYHDLKAKCFSILLVEDLIDCDGFELPIISKYQSAQKILHEMMVHFTGNSSKELFNEKKAGCEIIGIYSPCGGSGKTTLSIALGRALSIMQYKVLFISLEEASLYQAVLGNSGSSFSDLLYFIHKETVNLNLKLEGIKGNDYYSKLHFIPPVCFSEDMQNVTEDDWKLFIKFITEKSVYDYMIIDFTSYLTKEYLEVLRQCNKVLVPTNMSVVHNQKIKSFLNQEIKNDRERFSIIANFTSSIIEEEVNEILGNKILRYIPYIPNLYKREGDKINISTNSTFSEAINNLGKELVYLGTELD